MTYLKKAPTALRQSSFAELNEISSDDGSTLTWGHNSNNGDQGDKSIEFIEKQARDRIIREVLDWAEDAYYDRLAEERDPNRTQFCEDIDWANMRD